MSLSADKSRLTALTKELALKWSQTRESWRDAKSQEFERRYLDELFSSIEKAVTVIEQLDKLINKVRSDCE